MGDPVLPHGGLQCCAMPARRPAAACGALLIALAVPAAADAATWTAPLKPCYVTAGTAANRQSEGFPVGGDRLRRQLDRQPRRSTAAPAGRTAALLQAGPGGDNLRSTTGPPNLVPVRAVDQVGPARLHGHADRQRGARRTWRPRRSKVTALDVERRPARGQAVEEGPLHRLRLHRRRARLRALRPRREAEEDRPDDAQARRLRHLVGQAQADPRPQGEDRACGPSSSTRPSSTATAPRAA